MAGDPNRGKCEPCHHGSMATRAARTRTTAAAAPTPPPVEEPSRHTLRQLVERLHPAVLDVLASPRGLDVDIADPVILDPADAVPPPAESVVLAVGVDTPRAQVALLHQLADAGVAAVVFKHAGPLTDPVVAAAELAGATVLATPPALSWGQLYTFLLTASSAAPVAAPDQPEAPLGDLFALANAVAAMVGGATTIEDPANRVLAYSNLDFPIDEPRQRTILGRAVPNEWIQRLQDAGVFRRLWQTDDVIRVAEFSADEPGYLPRLSVAVRAGGELLGSIWVIEGAQPLGPEAERTLREAADIAALHLLRHRTASDVDRRRRAEALLGVLEGTDHSDRAREVLDLDPAQAVTVLAFDVGSAADASTLMSAQRVADLVAVYCESYRRQAACAPSGSRVYALVPTEPEAAGEQVSGLARAIVDRAGQALRLPLRAGIGSTVAGLDGVVASRREADEVLDVLAQGGGAGVASIEAMRAQVVVHRLRQLAAANPELHQGKIAALAEQDAAKGTAWVATLRAYFDAFGDMAEAAARVNVHPNTFRYRLRRITEVFGLDLSDPDERLVAELQLRFLDPSG